MMRNEDQVRKIRAEAFRDAAEWARSCSGESADVAADFIDEMAEACNGEATR